MADLTQDNKLMSISVDGQSKDFFLLQSFSGVEAISRPYVFQLDVLSETKDIDFSKILGKKATITLETSTSGQNRYFNGYISQFIQADGKGNLSHYRMDVVPWIWFLGLKADCRIFHNLSVLDIVKKILDTSPTAQKQSIDSTNIKLSYSKLEYCVQYRESSLHFISRLMEHAGIFFYFSHDNGSHTMYLSDDSVFCPVIPLQGNVSYVVKNTGLITEETVTTFHSRQVVRTGALTLADYNFETPSTHLTATENTVVDVGQNGTLEIFDYPGTQTTIEEGKKLSLLRMQEQEASQHVLSGTSNVRSFLTGHTFSLQDHPQTGAQNRNTRYLLTEVRHLITVGGVYLATTGSNNYSNQFLCVPSDVPFKPARITPKPLVQGSQTGRVIGKKDYKDTSGDDGSGDGEEIWVDQYGRVVVLFPWDRAGDCSCRVRVAQPWAGSGWGHQWIPRVGHEVVVTFLEGDPDRPLITGSVYNGNNALPFIDKGSPAMPLQTQSGIKTHSTPNGSASNCNIIRFEDKKGSEDLLIHAEATMHNSVEGSQFITVGGDRHITTGGIDKNGNKSGDVKELIFKNHNLHIRTDDRIKIEGESHIHIMGKADAIYDADFVQNMTGKCVIMADTIQLQAKTKIVLMAGSSSLVIDASGVTVLGSPLINLNTPGAPPMPEIAPLAIDPEDP